MRDNKPISLESHLSYLPVFCSMAEDEIGRIASSSKLIHLTKGEVLFHAGDSCRGFHLLVFGQIKLAFTSTQGTEKVTEIVQPGQSFGEATMILSRTYIVFAQALQDSTLIYIPKAAIQNAFEHDYEFTQKMLIGLARSNHDLMADVEAYSLKSAKQRTIGYLLHVLHHTAMDADGLEFELPARKGVIASLLNITQEHFSRVLHDLSERGLLEIRGKTIRIPSISNLVKTQDSS